MLREDSRRGSDVAEVGVAFMQRRWDGDHGDVEAGACLGSIGCGVPTGRQRPSQLVIGHVGRERGAVGKVLGAVDIEVEPDDIEPGLDGGHGKGQTDVALADDDDALVDWIGIHDVASQCPACARERARTQSSCLPRPSTSVVVGAQPRACRAIRVSAAVRRTSPLPSPVR